MHYEVWLIDGGMITFDTLEEFDEWKKKHKGAWILCRRVILYELGVDI